jgi:uncharacterized protein
MTWLTWACAAAILYGLASWGASRMMYYPMRYPAGDWTVQESLGAVDVWLTASDRTKLHAWWIAAPDSKLATLHLHGNGGNITHRDLSAQSIVAAGSSVLLLDYRGYGKSEGRPAERGLQRDAEAAYDYLAGQGYGPTQIIVHGESLGTAIAAHLASKKACAGLVLEAPFTSAKAVAGRVLPVIGPALVWGYNTMKRIKDIRVPVFVIHGDRDEVIAYEFGQELFAAANQPKAFWTIRNATHNNLHIMGREEFPIRLRAFYSGK